MLGNELTNDCQDQGLNLFFLYNVCDELTDTANFRKRFTHIYKYDSTNYITL